MVQEIAEELGCIIGEECIVAEGEVAFAGTVLCGTVEGPARALLTAERTALNFLQVGHS